MSWQKSFELKEFDDCWRISPVRLYEGYGTVELQKDLLDKGRKKNFSKWLSFTQAAVSKGEFHVGSSSMHYSWIDLLCENEGHPLHGKNIEQVRQFVEQHLQRPLITLTKTTYRPFPYYDSFMHIQGSVRYEQPEHLFGRDGSLRNLWDAERMCAAFFGHEDSKRVNRVSSWLSQKETYLSREHSKPSKSSHENTVCLYIGQADFHISINSPSQSCSFPAFGMRIRGLREVNY